MKNLTTMLRITRRADFAVAGDSLPFSEMFSLTRKFRAVARWTDVRTCVRTSVTGRGRPGPRKRRDRHSKISRIDIRSTRAEKSRWAEQADRYQLSLSEFVRIKVNDGKVRIATTADPGLLDELRRQGNNLNQLMHAIHAGFYIAPARVEAAIEALQALYRQEIGRR